MLAEPLDTATQRRRRVQIGDWWADAATNEIGRSTETVRIEPKVMEVLMQLAHRAGRLVTREELFTAVWPGVIVGDEALTQCIIKLRRALGDNPRLPSYIETIPKRGYRLIAPVRHAGDEAPGAAKASAASAEVQARWRARPVWLRAGALLAFAAAIAILVALVSLRSPTSAESDYGDDGRAPPLGVVVVPFESLADDTGQNYLARGIGDDLAIDLSRLSDLRVIRLSGAPIGSAAAQHARYLVSGSVQRAADTLRINVHLTDTRTKQQLWSERFERPFSDLFAVQDEMIGSLAELLPAKITAAERERLAKRHTRSLDAYDAFLHAQALFLVRQLERNEEARVLYRRALELDPAFARAYAGLAMTYAMEHVLRSAGPSSPSLARAAELADSARLIDPDLPEVHWAIGFVNVQGRRHEQAIGSLRKAIELNPSFADAYALMAGVYTYVGEPAKSIGLLRKAMRLNPDSGYLYFLILGRAYLFEHDIEQALINLREASARNPANLETRIYLAAARAAAGDRVAAEWEAEEIRTLNPGFSLQGWLDAYPLTSAPHRQELMGLLRSAGL